MLWRINSSSFRVVLVAKLSIALRAAIFAISIITSVLLRLITRLFALVFDGRMASDIEPEDFSKWAISPLLRWQGWRVLLGNISYMTLNGAAIVAVTGVLVVLIPAVPRAAQGQLLR